MCLIGLTKVMIEPALYMHSSLHFQLRPSEVEGGCDGGQDGIIPSGHYGVRLQKSNLLGSLSNVYPLPEE